MDGANTAALFAGGTNEPPGTFKLLRDDETNEHRQCIIVLDPLPSTDPNEPMNWSLVRKSVNFGIVLSMTVIIFTALSIQAIFWQRMAEDMVLTLDDLNKASSVNYVGLAIGCILFIPFAKKFGRRPVYIVSAASMVATSFWISRISSLGELYAANLVQGLAGATNESIAEMTIADLFFVHHRGSMNGLYMTCVMVGNFLTPMAAGAQATQHGWRSSYQTMGIFNAVIFLLFVFLYEETKYVPFFVGATGTAIRKNDAPDESKKDDQVMIETASTPQHPSITEEARLHQALDLTIPQRSWYQRFAFVTPTPEPIWPHFYRPFCVLIFPAIAFAAVQYACGIMWLTVTTSVLSLVFPEFPYFFSPAEIGYTGAGPLIGNIIGAFYGGLISDWSILHYAKRNGGYYEPEMRLYILHLPAVCMAGGLIMFGVTVSRGIHWVWPNLGGAFFAFGLGSITDVVLVLVIDSYREITGEAFTAVAFMRNALSIGIPFAISPWIQRNGIQNMFIVCGILSLAIVGLTIPLIIWGKSARRALAARYRDIEDEHGHTGPQ